MGLGHLERIGRVITRVIGVREVAGVACHAIVARLVLIHIVVDVLRSGWAVRPLDPGQPMPAIRSADIDGLIEVDVRIDEFHVRFDEFHVRFDEFHVRIDEFHVRIDEFHVRIDGIDGIDGIDDLRFNAVSTTIITTTATTTAATTTTTASTTGAIGGGPAGTVGWGRLSHPARARAGRSEAWVVDHRPPWGHGARSRFRARDVRCGRW